MIVAELGSTGAEEMSVFHGLLLEKGRNPLRLAPSPALATLQARLGLEPPVPDVPPVPVLFCDVLGAAPPQAIRNRNSISKSGSRQKVGLWQASGFTHRFLQVRYTTERGRWVALYARLDMYE